MHRNGIRHSGFSMIELSMALVIMGIIGSVAVISLRSSVAHSKLQLTVDRLTSDLQLVRDQALRDQRPHSVVFDLPRLSYKNTKPAGSTAAINIDVSLATAQYSVSTITLSVSSAMSRL